MKELIVFYDISNNKLRNKLIKVLESYGMRIQKSVFKCCVNKTQYKRMLNEIEKFEIKEDSIIIIELKEYNKLIFGYEEYINLYDDIII